MVPMAIHDAHGQGSMGLDARLSQVVSSFFLLYAAWRGLLIITGLILIAIPLTVFIVAFEYVLFGQSELLGFLIP